MLILKKNIIFNKKYRYRSHVWRKQKNLIIFCFSIIMMFFSLFWLFWILLTIFIKGINGISWNLFVKMTPPPNTYGGGLANAIAGSCLLILFSTIIGAPIGILSGIYLSEYGRDHWFAKVVRFINSILLSAPSIVVGLFIYTIIVLNMHHFSGFAGIISLSILQIPIIVQTTENILNLVSNNLREAAYALGAPKWKIVIFVILKDSVSGVVSGVLLSIAKIAGETGPLLFTALSNQFWSINLNEPIATLPVVIFKFAVSPFLEWQKLAWSGVLLIVIFILLINILARIFLKKKKY